jgi:hypothetical protein
MRVPWCIHLAGSVDTRTWDAGHGTSSTPQSHQRSAGPGAFDVEPMCKDRRNRSEELRCWDGQPLPPRLKMGLVREVDCLELLIEQLREIEGERDMSLRTTRSPAEKLREEPGVIPAALSDDRSRIYGPWTACDRGDAIRHLHELVPSVTTGFENVIVGRPHPMAEKVAT